MSVTGAPVLSATIHRIETPTEVLLSAIDSGVRDAAYYPFTLPAAGGLDTLRCYAGIVHEATHPQGELVLALGATSFIRILMPGADPPNRAYRISETVMHIDTDKIASGSELVALEGLFRSVPFGRGGHLVLMEALRARRNVMSSENALLSFLRSTKPLAL